MWLHCVHHDRRTISQKRIMNLWSAMSLGDGWWVIQCSLYINTNHLKSSHVWVNVSYQPGKTINQFLNNIAITNSFLCHSHNKVAYIFSMLSWPTSVLWNFFMKIIHKNWFVIISCKETLWEFFIRSLFKNLYLLKELGV